ncbi:MAG: AAA family ATPase [Stellaceae bacterium]
MDNSLPPGFVDITEQVRRDFPPDPILNGGRHKAAPSSEPEIWDAVDVLSKFIEPREWLLGNIFCKEFLSCLIGPGAVGKTAVRLVQALSLATGRSLSGDYVHRRCKVLILCFEDGRKEMERRVRAALMHHNVGEEARGWLFCAAITGQRLFEDGGIGTLETWLRTKIQRLGAELVIFDPFVKIHDEEENDNTRIDMVCSALARLGIEMNIAPDYLHHVRKGSATPGDPDAGRGAGAAKDAGRLGYTLVPMSEKERDTFGLSEKERRLIVRMDNAKVNIAAPSTETRWFRLIGVPIGNFTDTYPHGDEVQTVEPWNPPDLFAGLSFAILNQILDKIDAGMTDGTLYSSDNAAKKRAAWKVICDIAPDKTEAQARAIINTWQRNGVFILEEYKDPSRGEPAKGLRVNAAKRPG